MADRFESFASSLDSPASTAFAITPNDSADLSERCRAIFVGDAGNVVVDFGTVTNITFANCAAGTVLPVRATRVRATGTTAGRLVAIL